MCALQVVSTFLSFTGLASSSLGLLSSTQSFRADGNVMQRDTEPPEWMKDFEKNTKDFMEHQPKSRSIQRYHPSGLKIKKKRSLGSETQNNIPRNKKKISKTMLSSLARNRRDVPPLPPFIKSYGMDCPREKQQNATIQTLFCGVYTELSPNKLKDHNCTLEAPFTEEVIDATVAKHDYVLENECCLEDCENQGSDWPPFSFIDLHGTLYRGVKCQERCYTTANSTSQSPIPTAHSDQTRPTPTVMPAMTTVNPIAKATLLTATNQPQDTCDKKPFYYAIGAGTLAVGYAVLSTVWCAYQYITKRKEKSKDDQSETIALLTNPDL